MHHACPSIVMMPSTRLSHRADAFFGLGQLPQLDPPSSRLRFGGDVAKTSTARSIGP